MLKCTGPGGERISAAGPPTAAKPESEVQLGLTATATATANGQQQRSPTAHNVHTTSDDLAYATPENRKLSRRAQHLAREITACKMNDCSRVL
jgi:hypothetical protein